MANLKNRIGDVYDYLTVVEYSHKTIKPCGVATHYWKCRCKCGKEIVRAGGHLGYNRNQSCGCLRDDLCGDRFRTHGKKGTRVYNIWRTMLSRCYNKKNKDYKNYGAKGIKVCDEWRRSFKRFLSDMGKPPSLKHSIDRINGNTGYSLKNCRWATAQEQANNRKNNIKVKFEGKTMGLSEWSRELKIAASTAWYHYNKYGHFKNVRKKKK